MKTETYIYNKEFAFESGETLPGITIAYNTYGKLNPEGNNVIYVCHALTANSDVQDWWPDMVGEGLIFDTSKYFIVCANVLGSCYGTSGPTHINQSKGLAYGRAFPCTTIRDIVKAHRLLATHLGIKRIELICGGSLGGQQALEWSIEYPAFINKLFLIATNARHSAWGIAFNEAQRMAIEAGRKGLEAARAIAMLSYRNYNMYNETQTDEDDRTDHFSAARYQRYQGEKLQKRFDTDSYYILSKAMDSHNVGRGRISVKDALKKVEAQTLAVGISSDLLFPPVEQKFIANNIPNATYVEIDSRYGHDGFLIETKAISALLKQHLSI